MTDASPELPAATDSDARPAESESPKARQGSFFELIDNPWVVLVLLFFVMAILGLPVLWKSRGFSTFSKLVLSVVVTLYTALIFWLFYLVMAWCVGVIWNELAR